MCVNKIQSRALRVKYTAENNFAYRTRVEFTAYRVLLLKSGTLQVHNATPISRNTEQQQQHSFIANHRQLDLAMTDQARGEYLASGSSPLALLVDAANAKSQESSRGAGSSLDTNANRGTLENYMPVIDFSYLLKLHSVILQMLQAGWQQIKLLQCIKCV